MDFEENSADCMKRVILHADLDSFFASKTLLPVFTLYFLASFDAAIIQLLPFALTIPTGFLRRLGFIC